MRKKKATNQKMTNQKTKKFRFGLAMILSSLWYGPTCNTIAKTIVPNKKVNSNIPSQGCHLKKPIIKRLSCYYYQNSKYHKQNLPSGHQYRIANSSWVKGNITSKNCKLTAKQPRDKNIILEAVWAQIPKGLNDKWIKTTIYHCQNGKKHGPEWFISTNKVGTFLGEVANYKFGLKNGVHYYNVSNGQITYFTDNISNGPTINRHGGGFFVRNGTRLSGPKDFNNPGTLGSP